MQHVSQFSPDWIKLYKGKWAILWIWDSGSRVGNTRFGSCEAAQEWIDSVTMKHYAVPQAIVFGGVGLAMGFEEFRLVMPIPVIN